MGAVATPGQSAAGDSRRHNALLHSQVPQADTHDLLTAYCCVLDLVHDHDGTALRPPGLLGRIKLTIGLESYVIEHVRTNVDGFLRRYRARLAMGQDDGNDPKDRDTLNDFAASLPPPRSRLWVLLPYLAALAVTQVAISVIGHRASISVMHDLVGLASLNPQGISTSADHLIRQDQHVKVFGVMLIGSAALWLSFRPLMWGFRVKRILLNDPRALRRREKNCELANTGRRLDIRRREEDLCARLGMPAPADSRLDLWIKSTILVTPLIVGVAAVAAAIGDHRSRLTDAILAGLFLVLVALRLAWLARCARERSRYRDPELASTAKHTAQELMRQSAARGQRSVAVGRSLGPDGTENL
jgi:hypothetical protein